MHSFSRFTTTREPEISDQSTIRRYYVDSASVYRHPAVEAVIQEPSDALRVFVVARKQAGRSIRRYFNPLSSSYYNGVNFYGPSEGFGNDIFDHGVSSSDEDPEYFDEDIYSPTTTAHRSVSAPRATSESRSASAKRFTPQQYTTTSRARQSSPRTRLQSRLESDEAIAEPIRESQRRATPGRFYNRGKNKNSDIEPLEQVSPQEENDVPVEVVHGDEPFETIEDFNVEPLEEEIDNDPDQVLDPTPDVTESNSLGKRSITFERSALLNKKPRLANRNFNTFLTPNRVSPAGKVGNYLTGNIPDNALDQIMTKSKSATNGNRQTVAKPRGRPPGKRAAKDLMDINNQRITAFTKNASSLRGNGILISNKRKTPIARFGTLNDEDIPVSGRAPPIIRPLAISGSRRLGRTSGTSSIPERTSPKHRKHSSGNAATRHAVPGRSSPLPIEDLSSSTDIVLHQKPKKRVAPERSNISSASLLNSWYIAPKSRTKHPSIDGDELDALSQRCSRYPARSRLPPTQHWSSDYVNDGSSCVFLIGVSADEQNIANQAANASSDVMRTQNDKVLAIADQEAPDASLVLTRNRGRVEMMLIGDEHAQKKAKRVARSVNRPTTTRPKPQINKKRLEKKRAKPRVSNKHSTSDIDAILQTLYNDREKGIKYVSNRNQEMPTVYDSLVQVGERKIEYSSVAFPKERQWQSHDAVQYQYMHQTNRFRSVNVIIPPMQKLDFENVNTNYICGYIVQCQDATLHGPGINRPIKEKDIFLLPSFEQYIIINKANTEVKLVLSFVSV
ncbi:hypothetical protein BdWA1_001238 [Babesia duncani]|uniref:Uncharacterized protein n=1 Tax=Babesia duncani TaxID=323732 RepID=A0AAD9PNX3_9APIC|nr:hypothetical protein BdWA1_001238 [Babesia duncani]